MDTILALWKRLLSYRRSDWGVDDYPLRFRAQDSASERVPRWTVQVVNWWTMTGLGATREEAFADLRENLEAYRSGQPLPRPGTSVALQFAPSDELEKHWAIVSRIVGEVLGFDPDGIFISDGTSLCDFAPEGGDISGALQRIHEIFGVDVSRVESANLAEIASLIESSRRQEESAP